MDMDIKLTIVRQKNRQVLVSGPIGDKVLCYGLLEAAKDAIRDYVPGKIDVPKDIPLELMKKT